MIKIAVPLAYLATIAGAELLTVFVDPMTGILTYLYLMVIMILHSAAIRTHSMHRFYLALGLVPLIRIVSISMPLSEASLVYWYLIMAIPIVVGVFTLLVALRIRPSEIGLKLRGIPLQALVATSGIVIGLADYMILRPDPLISALSWREVMIPALILLVATGFVEELAFRGVLQRASEEVGSWGWVYVAVVSSLLQIGQRSVLHWLLALGLALIFGWVVKRTGSIVGVSLAHGLVNVGVFLIFPFIL